MNTIDAMKKAVEILNSSTLASDVDDAAIEVLRSAIRREEAKTVDLLGAAKRLIEHADFRLGGILSADSKVKEIPSNAVSQVKARHLAALRDAIAKEEAWTVFTAVQRDGTEPLMGAALLEEAQTVEPVEPVAYQVQRICPEEGPSIWQSASSDEYTYRSGKDDWNVRKLFTRSGAPQVAVPQVARKFICPVVTVADLANNLLLMDQSLPIYGAQYIDHPTRGRCAIAVSPPVSRERVMDARWIGQGDELNAAVVWTRAPQPPQADAPFSPDWAGYRQGVEDGKAEVQPVVVPQAMSHFGLRDIELAYVSGWNNCRSAMIKSNPQPPQAERVPLTEDEIDAIWEALEHKAPVYLVRAVEARLL